MSRHALSGWRRGSSNRTRQGGFILLLVIVLFLDSAHEIPRKNENDYENENNGLVSTRLPDPAALAVQGKSTLQDRGKPDPWTCHQVKTPHLSCS
jgi:hypothetical protein